MGAELSHAEEGGFEFLAETGGLGVGLVGGGLVVVVEAVAELVFG